MVQKAEFRFKSMEQENETTQRKHLLKWRQFWLSVIDPLICYVIIIMDCIHVVIFYALRALHIKHIVHSDHIYSGGSKLYV